MNSYVWNTSESDFYSYEATKAVTNKAQKKIWGFNGIWTHDLRDTDVMLGYQLRAMALLVAGQEWVQFILVIWREWNDMCMV